LEFWQNLTLLDELTEIMNNKVRIVTVLRPERVVSYCSADHQPDLKKEKRASHRQKGVGSAWSERSVDSLQLREHSPSPQTQFHLGESGVGASSSGKVLGAIERGSATQTVNQNPVYPQQHVGMVPQRQPPVIDYGAVRGTAPLAHIDTAEQGLQLKSLETGVEGEGVIQGFWKQVVGAAILGMIAGGVIAVTAGAATPLVIGAAVLGGGLLTGGATAGGMKGVEAYKNAQPQVTIRQMPGVPDKDYSDGYRDIKAAMGTGDPTIVFDDASQTIKCYQSFRYLREAFPPLEQYLSYMVPNAIRENIAGAFTNPHFAKKAAAETQDLTSKAQDRAVDFAISDPRTAEYHRTLQSAESTQDGLIRLMTENEGLVIGEGHSDQGSKALVMDHIEQLKKAGVDTIYLEHIKTNYQPAIDQWFLTHDPSAIPLSVERSVTNTDVSKSLDTKQYNVLKLIKAAIANGIRVVGVDNDAASSDGTKGGRVIKMNVLVEDLVNGDRSRNGKYIIIVGADHGPTATDASRSYGVAKLPGISDLLNIPAVRYNEVSDTLTIDVEAIL